MDRPAPAPAPIAATGAMADRVRALDWAATPAGALAAWPDRLAAAVELMLAMPALATLAVGPARLFLYNDAAAPLYGDRHPGVLGMPLAEAFAHEFATVAGFYDRVFAGESVHVPAQRLDPSAADRPEVFDVYLTPVRDTDGTILAALMTGSTIATRGLADAAGRRTEEEYRVGLERRLVAGAAELAASHALLQGTIDASDDMIQVLEAVRDDGGAIVDFRWALNNRTAERRFGKVGQQSLLQRNPGALEDGVFDTFKRVTETGVPDQRERHHADDRLEG